ncbi:hypothetical protein JKY79_00805 [Candidatus Babeliales bacterium]|nr:hypothetical protein [Candidatus Babeliales bacterium]
MRRILAVLILSLLGTASLDAALSSSGSKGSLKGINLPQVVLKVAMISSKQEQVRLYHSINNADRKDGMKRTMQYLFASLGEETADWSDLLDQDTLDDTDWFAMAAKCVLLGSMKKLLKYKKDGDEDRYVVLAEEIEVTKNCLLDCLQSIAGNSTSTSPRGSKDGVVHHKKKSIDILVRLPCMVRDQLDQVLIECLSGC